MLRVDSHANLKCALAGLPVAVDGLLDLPETHW